MEKTKAAATAHSGTDPGGPGGPQLSYHRPNMPQKEGLEEQQFPPPIIPRPQRAGGEAARSTLGSALSHTCAGRGGSGDREASPTPAPPPRLLVQQQPEGWEKNRLGSAQGRERSVYPAVPLRRTQNGGERARKTWFLETEGPKLVPRSATGGWRGLG